MLLRAEDQAKFQGRIDDKGATVWASYRIEGRVEGKPVVQSDKVYPGTVHITFECGIAWLPLSPLRWNCADCGSQRRAPKLYEDLMERIFLHWNRHGLTL